MNTATHKTPARRTLSPAILIAVLPLCVLVVFLPFWAQIAVLTLALCGFVSWIFGVRLNCVDIFSPYILFPILWSACVAVGSIVISIEQVPWNSMVWYCCIGALAAYMAGLLMADWYLMGFSPPDSRRAVVRLGDWDGRKLLLVMLVWQVVAIACMVYEFRNWVGGIPLLNRGWEQVRLYNPEGYLSRLIHLFGYSFMLQSIVLQVYLYSRRRLFTMSNLPFWFMNILALGCAVLWGSRHTLFIPVAAGVVAFHYLYRRLRITHLIVLGIVGALFIGAVGYIRKISYFEQRDLEYDEILYEIGYSGRFPVLDQIHNTIGINFEIFRQITETFPRFYPYQYGRQTFFAFYGLLPGKQETLGELQNRIWNTAFYGNLTSTYMGAPYSDFGLPGILVFTVIIAFLIRLLYYRFRHYPTVFNIMLFSYMCYHVILMPYDNTFTKLNIFFDLAILWFVNMLIADRASFRPSQADAIPAHGGTVTSCPKESL